MKRRSLFLLRVSVGFLMIFWGIDKLVNTGHAVQVSDSFYLGLFSFPWLQQGFGVFETFLGLAVVVGWKRKTFYPALIVINAVSAASCWKSIIDPWGWVFKDSMVLLYPSIIILFACLVLSAFTRMDTICFDERFKPYNPNL